MTPQSTNRRRVPPALLWLAVPLLLAGLAFAWWTLSPLFLNTRVDEAFPTAVAAPTVAAVVVAAPTVAPALPAAVAVVEVAPTVAPALPTAAPAQPTAIAEPVALASGSFTRIDSLHAAEGTAIIYQLPDGSRVLRLENFSAQNGPDLYVSLSGHPMPRSNAETFDSGYVELERLKANQGNQNYALPAELDLAALKSVVIYCKAFSVVFSTAELLGL
jgi:hypothetical protein